MGTFTAADLDQAMENEGPPFAAMSAAEEEQRNRPLPASWSEHIHEVGGEVIDWMEVFPLVLIALWLIVGGLAVVATGFVLGWDWEAWQGVLVILLFAAVVTVWDSNRAGSITRRLVASVVVLAERRRGSRGDRSGDAALATLLLVVLVVLVAVLIAVVTAD